MPAAHTPPSFHCENCSYFMTIDRAHGHCHRYPPNFGGESSPRECHRWKFPVVAMHDWCGEFKPTTA